MATWCWWASLAYIPTALAALNGDFEAFYWFIQTKSDLVPEIIRENSGQYFNRMNGVIIGFTNTSYKQPLTNWTNFTNEHKGDYDYDDHSGEEETDAFTVEATKPGV